MNRFFKIGVILMAAAVWAGAQRLDDCQTETTSADGSPQLYHSKPAETLDRNLLGAGYRFTKVSLLSGLHDPRPDVRSLAAAKLSEIGETSSVTALAEALATEKDGCARGAMGFAIGFLAERKHAGGQWNVAPFQSCTPSQPPVLTLAIEQETLRPDAASGPVVHISARNVSGRVAPFAWTLSPGQLFSVTLLEPGGGRARIPKEKELLYHPISEAPAGTVAIGGHAPMGMALAPGEEFSWDWRVASDFDVSTPGTYRLSFGGPLEYLNTTVCSNTIDVTVK
jgi:hypothetical protein